MELDRSSGVLLHPSSLPGPYGIGEFGKPAFKFIDFLYSCGQKLWQILPLGPTGYGDSPYSSFSSFAGNSMLISLEVLLHEKLLKKNDLNPIPNFSNITIDYADLQKWKVPLLKKAALFFLKNKSDSDEFRIFCTENDFWLEDYALFMSLKEWHGKKGTTVKSKSTIWYEYWEKDFISRKEDVLTSWKKNHHEEIEIQKVWQFFFFSQWQAVRKYANKKGVKIIGDIPIFVAADSSDVWANKEIFYLDEEDAPTVVSGVPPDYFSKTGQLWGNPLYNWKALKETGYKWWLNRLRRMFQLVDVVRIDHFRGLEAYWEVPAGAKTAEKGKWVKADGDGLFAAVKKELGSVPIIVEDLGVITPEVDALRKKWGFPGMAVLQFAFYPDKLGNLDASNSFCPHNHLKHQVVYTGSHDNNTTYAWYHQLPEEYKDVIRRYMGRPDHDINWEFIRMALASPAGYSIIPMQDLMEIGEEGRMNIPSTVGGNWCWRFLDNQLTDYLKQRLTEMTRMYNRV